MHHHAPSFQTFPLRSNRIFRSEGREKVSWLSKREDELLRRARLADMASHLDDQTNSFGLQSPKGASVVESEGVLIFCRSLNFSEKWSVLTGMSGRVRERLFSLPPETASVSD